MSSSRALRRRVFVDGVYEWLVADERLHVGTCRRAFAYGCATSGCRVVVKRWVEGVYLKMES